MNRWRVLICVVACHLTTTAVFAQVEQMNRASGSESPLSFGVQLGVVYTDNRDSSKSADEEDALDITVSPFIDGRMDRDLTLLEYGYKFTARYRDDPSEFEEENQYFHDAHLSMDYQVTPTTLIDVRDDLHYSDDPEVDEGGTTVRQDGSFLLNEVAALLSHEVIPRHFAEVNGYSRTKRFDEDDIAVRADEDMTSVGATWWYQVTDQMALLLLATQQEFDYDDPDIERGFEATFYGVGVFASMGPASRVSARIGSKQLEFDDDSLEDEDDVVGELAIRNSEKAKVRYRIAGGHTLRDADLAPFASMEYDFASIRVSRDLSESVIVRASGSYRMLDYNNQVPAGALTGLGGGTEDELTITAGLEVRTSRKSRILVKHVFQTVDSDVDVTVDRVFDRNVTSVTWVGEL